MAIYFKNNLGCNIYFKRVGAICIYKNNFKTKFLTHLVSSKLFKGMVSTNITVLKQN